LAAQLNIRNQRVIDLAQKYAAKTGMSMSDVVLQALQEWSPEKRASVAPETRADSWRKLLALDHGNLRPGYALSTAEFYDANTGEPV
jgi:hypothetical protein